MNHSEDKLALVSNSFEIWILKVIDEIEKYGSLLHPSDYFYRNEQVGIYKNISNEMNLRR